MAKSELRPYISGLVISEEVGAAKPNPLMLEKGMELARATDKRRALMLGDSLTSDIAAAKNAGIDACWFNPKGAANDKSLPIAYEIASLDEVDAIAAAAGPIAQRIVAQSADLRSRLSPAPPAAARTATPAP